MLLSYLSTYNSQANSVIVKYELLWSSAYYRRRTARQFRALCKLHAGLYM